MPYKSRWTIPIPDCSLPTFLFKSASHSESSKQCYIDAAAPETQYFTRASFKLWSQRLALGITRLPGFEAGDRVLLFSPNNLAVPVVFMGILMAGGIFSAANPGYTGRELANQLRDSEARYLLVADGNLDVALEAADIVGLDRGRVRWFDQGALFDGKGTQTLDKGVKQEIRYWSGLFAGEEEARLYQWPELKGES